MSTEENPFGTGVTNPGYRGPDEEIEMGNIGPDDSSRTRDNYQETSFTTGEHDTSPLLPPRESSPIASRTRIHAKNPIIGVGHMRYQSTGIISEQSGSDYNIVRNERVSERERKMNEAWELIKRKFPNFNPANAFFTATMDDWDRVIVKLNRSKGKYHFLFDVNGEISKELPKTITNNLGLPAEKVIEVNNEEIIKSNKRISALKSRLELTTDENQKEIYNKSIGVELDNIGQLERTNEEIERRMTLRDRVKAIFKKYGFTVLAVVSAVSVVIGVIVSNLKNGLTTLGKGVGNGLKSIGKKLGEILPGLAGAIASFVFRTAGEVVSFLAKNAWLLIVAVVLYLIEQFKKKK